MKKIILNFTPHQVNIFDDGEIVKTFASNGVARVSTITEKSGDINGIPVFNNKFGKVQGLPDFKDDTVVIVSSLVRLAMPNRKDLVSPDTSPDGAVRDPKTNFIIGVRGFQI